MFRHFDPHFINPVASNKATVHLYVSDAETPYGHIPATSMTLHNALAVAKALRRHFDRYCAVTLESTSETVFADRKVGKGKKMRMMYWHQNSICVTYYPTTGDYRIVTTTTYSPTSLPGDRLVSATNQTDSHELWVRRLH